jgi:hypothetical protein
MPIPKRPQPKVKTARTVSSPDTDEQQQEALIRTLLLTVQHFFGGFALLFGGVHDPRHLAYITYSLESLLTTGVLLFVFRLAARRQIAHWLRGNHQSQAKFTALLGVDTVPHGDTLNVASAHLNVAEVQAVVTGMTETLIRRKVLYPSRLFAHYFLVVMDGTGMLTFAQRHCPHCLTRTRKDGQTIYYHPVLEAKVVTPNGFAFSLMTEFIENPGEHPTKQDCELKAFYRLTERLKQRFPRLPICLGLDSLFAGGPTFTRCERYGWAYIITLQEGDLPSVHEEFHALTQLTPENHLRFHTGPQSQTHQDFRWVNDIAYQDSQHREHSLAVVECLESEPQGDGRRRTTRFKWVTNFAVTKSTVITLANQGGRLRWKIENEGFNTQKNGGFALEHAYSEHPVASKVFYFLLQIAHLLSQLMEKGSLLRTAFPAGVGSAKNLALRLLEAWRNLRLSPEQLRAMLAVRIQIRFDTS